MPKKLPLIVILGATACGKSKLAIELARRFGGEIIGADSMQVYRGLDIATNKVTEEEEQQAKHHMISFVDPMTRYSVVDFRNKSLNIIESLHERNKLPIVVGGTNYYIESLIWKNFILSPTFKLAKRPLVNGADDESTEGQEKELASRETLIESEAKLLNKISKESLHTDEDLEDIGKFFEKQIYHDGLAEVPSEKLWHILEQVDPDSAHLNHPNDKRRIIRCLQIFQENKRNYSDLLKDINKSGEEGDKTSLGGPLRFEPTCVILLDCDYQLLDKILDERVDQMLARGLLAELEKFHEDYNQQRIEAEYDKLQYNKGVWQTIGFKEFHDYLVLEAEAKDSPEGNQILVKSIEAMKLSTRQYARKQMRWIRSRFLRSGTRDLPCVFKLTTSLSEEEWRKQVREPAFEIVKSLIEQQPLSADVAALKHEPQERSSTIKPGKLYCEPCDRMFIGSSYIESHLKSRTHEKMVKNFKKKQRTV